MGEAAAITRAITAAVAAFALSSCVVPEAELPPPLPCDVMPDGAFNEPAWTSAQRIALGDTAALLLIQAPQHLCIGVDTRNAGARYVDVFIQDSQGVTHNLHASMQVGERTVPARWTDEEPATNWGQTTLWVANNVARRADANTEAPISEQLAPYQGYEFMIARSRMPRPWRVRVEVRDFDGRARDIVYPSQSRRNDIRSWALFL